MIKPETHPFEALIGIWSGDKGIDISPEPDGTETSPYYETITFTPTSNVDNADVQELFVIQYHQVVRRKSTGNIFHDQSGYWMWEEKEKMLIHSFTIPRGLNVLAKGEMKNENGVLTMEVSADSENKNYGITESIFMEKNAHTKSFRQKFIIENGTLTYSQTTSLDIYGREFEHTDDNVLILQK